LRGCAVARLRGCAAVRLHFGPRHVDTFQQLMPFADM